MRTIIRYDRPKLGIRQQCNLVSLSRWAFYYSPVGTGEDTLSVMKRDDRVFTKYPFFGSCQITDYLRRESIVVECHRVRRFMGNTRLEAINKRRSTSQPHPQRPVLPYLLRKMAFERLN